MKKSKDPFEAAFEEQDDESPNTTANDEMQSNDNAIATDPSSSAAAASMTARTGNDEDEDHMDDAELGRSRSSGDPAKMQESWAISRRSRYESFRRSRFQKSNMKRLVSGLIGSAKISVPMTIVVSGIAKMFVGEVIETARVVMAERRDTGPIRPCHVREVHRRLKLEGKVPKIALSKYYCHNQKTFSFE